MTKKTPYSAAERACARELYEAAKAAGALKPPRALYAAAFSDGRRMSASCSVTENDYLPDARRHLNGSSS